MGTINLVPPVSGTVATAAIISNAYTTLQTVINGNLDTANWATGKIFAPSKLMQEAAVSGQVLRWNGTSSLWVPDNGYATTLPGSPFDGQEATLVDSVTVPTYQWRFRYNAGSSNADKWEYMGGTAAFAEVATAETTASTTYAALATAGPSFTVPRAGVYDVTIGHRNPSSTVAGTYVHSYDIGGTGASDNDAIIYTVNPITALPGGFSRTRRKTGLAASTALVSKYKTSAGTTGFADRIMQVIPVRVS